MVFNTVGLFLGSEPCCILLCQPAGSVAPQSPLGHPGSAPSAWVIFHISLTLEVCLYVKCALLCVLSSDFQNMPNAMRPSAPRPQTFNTIRATTTTNTQVPRMMASQRMRKEFTLHPALVVPLSRFWTNRVFLMLPLATQALGQRPANASATAAQVRPMPQYKYAAGVRNPQQHMASQPQVAMQQVSSYRSPSLMCGHWHCRRVRFGRLWLDFVLNLRLFLSLLSMSKVRSPWLRPCWLLHLLRSRSRCWVSERAFSSDRYRSVGIFELLFNNFSWFLFIKLWLTAFLRRWASVPPHPEYASQPGWQDHWYASGDRQLWAPPHAWITWISALQGLLIWPVYSLYVVAVVLYNLKVLSMVKWKRFACFGLDEMFAFRWMRLLLCCRPTRPKRLLRSPPPLPVFPASKVCSSDKYSIEFCSPDSEICTTNIVLNNAVLNIYTVFILYCSLSILKPASPMEKEKKNLNIEKPKTQKTLQNDKLFLKKTKQIESARSGDGLTRPWSYTKICLKKNSKIDKIENCNKFECIPLFYVILLCQCSNSQHYQGNGCWAFWDDLYRKLLAVINRHSKIRLLVCDLLTYLLFTMTTLHFMAGLQSFQLWCFNVILH